MNRVNSHKKVIGILSYVAIGVSALVIVLFIFHLINVQKYNAEWRKVTPGTSATQVLADIHPRGGASDSWVKTDTGMDTDLNAKIYELVVTNNAHTDVEEWNIRFNISEECYLNNGWCGTFEVHQADRVSGTEREQTVDLRDFRYSDLYIENYHAGQDLLIPLNKGDHFIYHPSSDEAIGEQPLKGSEGMSGAVAIGIIMYSKSGNVDLNDYELSYRLKRSVWDGNGGRFFIAAFCLLGLSFLILALISFVSVRFEDRIKKQSKLLKDLFDISVMVADSGDYYSKGHSERVAEYSRMIAEKMGMDKSDCELVFNAARLHNIGNIYVSDQILRKNGRLTREEFAEVKKHTVRGAELLKDISSIPNAAEAALDHHENFDGSGYPNGKKEDEIPLIARIIAVADAYDAMNNDRPYRKKLMHDQIREELIKNRGTRYDPEIVTAFLDIMGERNL